jgi:hypothetical protein
MSESHAVLIAEIVELKAALEAKTKEDYRREKYEDERYRAVCVERDSAQAELKEARNALGVQTRDAEANRLLLEEARAALAEAVKPYDSRKCPDCMLDEDAVGQGTRCVPHEIVYLKEALASESLARREAEEELADWKDSYKTVMEDKGAPDEQHCGCVVHWKKSVADLERKLQIQRGKVQRAHAEFHKLSQGIHDVNDDTEPDALMRLLAKVHSEALERERGERKAQMEKVRHLTRNTFTFNGVEHKGLWLDAEQVYAIFSYPTPQEEPNRCPSCELLVDDEPGDMRCDCPKAKKPQAKEKP